MSVSTTSIQASQFVQYSTGVPFGITSTAIVESVVIGRNDGTGKVVIASLVANHQERAEVSF